MTHKLSIGGTLAAATLILVSSSSQAKDEKSPDKKAQKGECHGVNSCKGQGECGGPKWDCAGNNDCKGKGWVTRTAAECKKLGGKFKADN